MSEFESEPGGGDELDVVEQYTGGGDVALAPDAPDWAAEIIADHHVDAEPGTGEQPEPEAPSWSGISRDEWEQTQQAVQYFASLVADAEQTAQAEAQAEQWEADVAEYLGDEWEPEYAERLAEVQQAQLAEEVRAYIDERVAPLAELQQEQLFSTARTEADQLLDRDFGQLGVNLDDELRSDLRALANRVLPEYQELLVSQGVPRVVAFGRGPALEVLHGLADFYRPGIDAANRPPGDLIDVARRHASPPPLPPTAKAITRAVLGQGPFNGSWVRPKEMI